MSILIGWFSPSQHLFFSLLKFYALVCVVCFITLPTVWILLFAYLWCSLIQFKVLFFFSTTIISVFFHEEALDVWLFPSFVTFIAIDGQGPKSIISSLRGSKWWYSSFINFSLFISWSTFYKEKFLIYCFITWVSHF